MKKIFYVVFLGLITTTHEPSIGQVIKEVDYLDYLKKNQLEYIAGSNSLKKMARKI
jgi:hypothetical protein